MIIKRMHFLQSLRRYYLQIISKHFTIRLLELMRSIYVQFDAAYIHCLLCNRHNPHFSRNLVSYNQHAKKNLIRCTLCLEALDTNLVTKTTLCSSKKNKTGVGTALKLQTRKPSIAHGLRFVKRVCGVRHLLKRIQIALCSWVNTIGNQNTSMR